MVRWTRIPPKSRPISTNTTLPAFAVTPHPPPPLPPCPRPLLQGPELFIPDTRIVFNWKFNGIGRQFCYLDGRRYNNDRDFMCRRWVVRWLQRGGRVLTRLQGVRVGGFISVFLITASLRRRLPDCSPLDIYFDRNKKDHQLLIINQARRLTAWHMLVDDCKRRHFLPLWHAAVCMGKGLNLNGRPLGCWGLPAQQMAPTRVCRITCELCT